MKIFISMKEARKKILLTFEISGPKKSLIIILLLSNHQQQQNKSDNCIYRFDEQQENENDIQVDKNEPEQHLSFNKKSFFNKCNTIFFKNK